MILILKISQEVKKTSEDETISIKRKKKEALHNLISWETRALLKVVNIIKIIAQPQEKNLPACLWRRIFKFTKRSITVCKDNYES